MNQFFKEEDIRYFSNALIKLVKEAKILDNTLQKNKTEYAHNYNLILDIILDEETFQNQMADFHNILEDDGYLCLIVPTSVLMLTRFYDFRKCIMANPLFHIHAIFEVNRMMTTALPASIMVFSKQQTATTTFISSPLEKLEDAVAAYESNPLENKYTSFQVETLLAKNLHSKFYDPTLNTNVHVLNQLQTKKLHEIADVFSGYSAKVDQLTGRDWKYLRPRDIQGEKLIDPKLYISDDYIGKFAHKTLIEGDILISKHFGSNKVYQIKDEDLPAVASSSFLVIRCEEVPSHYLFQYISSHFGKTIFESQLKMIEKGVTIKSINLRDLKELDIPVLSKEFMIMIANMDNLPLSLIDELSVEIDSLLGQVAEENN